jgi:hypothetical protein
VVTIRRPLLISILVGAAAILAAASTVSARRDKADPTPAPPPVPTSAATRGPVSSAPPAPSPRTTAAHAPASPSTPHVSATSGQFSLVVETDAGDIAATVGAIDVTSNQPVDPPHSTDAEWNTAVWVRQSVYPSPASGGTSYVYGHACHYHVCPFTRLSTARVGDRVQVRTPTDHLTYRIVHTGLSPKAAASLPSWASDSTAPNRLVLVTCSYEKGDTSVNNLVVVARLLAP